jgi:hypothetical protein
MGSMTHHDDGHDELQRLAARLRAERPTASPLELDALKQRVLARAARPRPTTRRSSLMRTRAAIMSMLALGFVLSTTGAGLAVTGLSDNNQAASAQYPETPPATTTPPPATPPATTTTPPPATTPESGVLGEEAESAPQPQPDERQQVLPDNSETPQQPAADVQPDRQVVQAAEAGTQLPFTGFAALPVLLLGLALLSGGLFMRRASRAIGRGSAPASACATASP